ncbi:MAG TPA: LysR substrate-binding domain-containing protein [Polyangiales bacterium]|nr:LysR substrate-binding domain-containing protein [Polyangiales bacterium]
MEAERADSSDETHAIQAAIAGQGVALLSEAVVAEELRTGALVQPFGPSLPSEAYHVVYPERAADDPRVVAVRSWLLREARKFTEQGKQVVARDAEGSRCRLTREYIAR